MAGEVRTCTNCGNQQATGVYCERCGTRLPELAPAQAAAAASQQTSTPPNQDAAQSQHSERILPAPFNRLFDFSFQGFVTRGSLRLLFVSTLVLLGVYWLLALIFGIVAAAKYQPVWCIVIFSSLVLVTLMIIWTRVMMELTMTMSEMRAELRQAEQAAEVRAAEAKAVEAARAAEAAKAAVKPVAKTTTRGTTKAAPKTNSKTPSATVRSTSKATARGTSTSTKK